MESITLNVCTPSRLCAFSLHSLVSKRFVPVPTRLCIHLCRRELLHITAEDQTDATRPRGFHLSYVMLVASLVRAQVDYGNSEAT